MKTYPFLDLGLANKPIEDELKKAAKDTAKESE